MKWFGILLFITTSTAIISSTIPASAYWVDNGIVVCDDDTTQAVVAAVSDGSGGAIIAWQDTRDQPLYQSLYLQRINQRGEVQWPDGGVPISTTSGSFMRVKLVADGNGGAYIALGKGSVGTMTYVSAGRVSSDGVVIWTGSPYLSAGNTGAPDIDTDGAGGCIVCWHDDREGNDNIYAQRFDADGNKLWGNNGVFVCLYSSDQTDPKIAFHGTEAVIVWRDERALPGVDLYAQEIDTSGVRQWDVVGMPVCVGDGDKDDHQIITDNQGRPVIAWVDDRNGNDDIYAQTLTFLGNPGWTTAGVPVCTAVYTQNLPRLIPYGYGGVIIVWRDQRYLGTSIDIYGQYLEGHGVPQWGTDGRAVCSVVSQKNYPGIIVSQNDAIISWKDNRSGEYNVYSQKVDGNGDPLWSADGVAITDLGFQDDPLIVPDGEDGAIIAWDDMTIENNENVRAQKISAEGETANPFPLIRSVADIPEDEGGYARIDLCPSNRDLAGIPFPQVTLYNVWRSIETVLATSSIDEPAAEERGHAELLALARDPYRDEPLRISAAEAAAMGLPPGTWESIGLHIAMQQPAYYFTVPTRQDSSQSGNHQETFIVSAHTSDPELYFISYADSGYSVDNIAPSPPLALAGEQSYVPEGLQLTWNPNEENDLWYYGVYRGTSSDFIPGTGNLVATPAGVEWFDGDWSWDSGYWYKVAAVDIHGNESLYSVFGPDLVTGDDPMPLPDATFLAQNYPNPFNPITTIGFGLKAPGHVSLRVYDASGRLVTTLIDGSRPAGSYTTEWNGKDQNGSTVASGVYFYKLTATEFVETKKMILLR